MKLTRITTIGQNGQVTIPGEIRRAARLEEGDPVLVEIVEDSILLRPQKVIDAAQAWFWEPAWQEGEREATEQLRAGRGKKFKSGKFLATLE